MTISLKHAFTSLKGDPADTTLVRPSNWNAEHTLLMATASVLGRATAGAGAVEELSCTAAGRAILAAADAAAQLALILSNDSVTYAKIQNVTATDRLLGRFTAAAGDIEEVTLGPGISFVAGALTVSPNLPRGYIDGCILSNGTDAANDINITAGVCRDSTNTVNIDVLANTSGKQLDSIWIAAATTNTGMRNSAQNGGSIANGTYHIYAARTAASSTATIYAYAGVAGTDPDSAAAISTMLTALQGESGGSSYIYARRIRSITRSGGSIVAFTQTGDFVRLKSPPLDISTSTLDTTPLTSAISVPAGLSVQVLLSLVVSHASAARIVYVYNPSDTASIPSDTAAPLATITGSAGGSESIQQALVFCNTSSSVTYVSNASATIFRVAVLGYWDTRGKDA